MVVDNEILQSFFSKQKKPRIDSLVDLRNVIHKVGTEKIDHLPNQYQTDNKVVTNQYQTDNKVVTNQYQTDNKTDNKVVTNQYQTDNKTDNKVVTNQYQTDNKVVTNQYQTDNRVVFNSLTGLQKNILIFIYILCKISHDKSTGEISITQLASQCESTVGAIKTSIHRLINKGFLLRKKFKNGRCGWTVYSVPDNTYQEISSAEITDKLITNWYQTGTKLVTKYSSSSIYNNTTTTSDETDNSLMPCFLPREWENIDIDPLNSIGFTSTHLSQIVLQNILSVQVVQDSINAFSFDLNENNKSASIKGDPLNFFMGILRNGKPYAPPANYESPQDRAMRIYLEKKKEIEQNRMVMEQQAFEYAFNDWSSKLSDTEKLEYVPPISRSVITGPKGIASCVKQYFRENIWPDELEKIKSS